MVKKICKIALFLSLVMWFLVISLIIVLFIKSPYTQRRMHAKFTSIASRVCLDIFNIQIMLSDPDYLNRIKANNLIVSNHVSYLDIIVLSALFPTLFITSVEVKKTFLLGTLCKFAGCLFVERRSPSKLKKEIDSIAETLWQGHTVTLFPEGTTSNGESILPFKTALFTSAILSEVDVRPVCCKYLTINGDLITKDNRDLICYYGKAKFFSHLMKLFSIQSIYVSVDFLEPISTVGKTREEVSKLSYDKIFEQFNDLV